MKNANLRNADLRNAILSQAKVAGASFGQADVAYAALNGVSIWNSDAVVGAKNLLSACGLTETVAKVRRVLEGEDSRDLRGLDLQGWNLCGAYFAGVDLSATDLRRARLIGVNFEGANLEYADLRGARLKNACFEDANMHGCRKSWFGGWLEIKKVPSAAQLGAAPRAALLGCADVGKAKPECTSGAGSSRYPASEMAGILELRETLQKLRGLAPADKLAQMELGLETLEQLNRVLPELRDEAVISKTKEEATLLEDAVRREVLTCQKNEEEARATLLWKEAEQVRLRLAA